MKKHLFFLGCLFILSISNLYAQSFSYEYKEYGVNVIPTFDSFSSTGRKGGVINFDQDYLRGAINKEAIKCLPKDVLTILSSNPKYFYVHFTADKTGGILYMQFQLRNEVFPLMKEKQFVNLYNDFKKMKLDMNKADLNYQYQKYGDFDFFKISIPVYKP